VPLALGFVSDVFVLVAAVVIVLGLALALVDALATPRPERVVVSRVADPQLSIGVGNRIALRVANPSRGLCERCSPTPCRRRSTWTGASSR
jgi:hypothetical protein